ncbi:MAG: mechanosensitive ion channel domain-containing protein [Desulfobacterales bacterium]|jgi:small conductance mechanosensitive channel
MSLPTSVRIVVIVLLAIFAHFTVQGLKRLSGWMLTLKLETDPSTTEIFTRRYPKIATVTTILVSGLNFAIYFMAIGLILREFNVSLTAYLASASVIGLAVGFGLQGLVQDVVIGLTLIFSDVLNIEDVVEMSGQVGKVENIGLRFTTLVNLHGQKIYVPNRNITMISRFRRGSIRGYVDIQLPDEIEEETVTEAVKSIATGLYSQQKSIILEKPELFGVKEAKGGNWRYLRVKFRLWPGQTAIIETTFKQRVIDFMKKTYPNYADWMITIAYRVE